MPIGNLNTEADLLAFMDEHRLRDLSAKVNELRGKVTFGTGAPSGEPKNGSALFLRLDPAAGAAVYAWDGSGSWVAVA